ncbi:hypothetical protein [Sandarakinorhabdus rubra]|uniref:hypothetical protein n=1 Tax=Sandarakinorhabdus rubra TaxID=2672568 RepID=UPI0013D92903|nr:hypothetical protein [Sandarakinorhabdus rubra]
MRVAALRSALALALAVGLAGCERNPLVVKRSSCPAVAVAAYAGDVSLFRPGPPDAANLDVTASITNLRDDCVEAPEQFVTRITYEVVARRSEAGPARQVVLPVFAAVVQAGNIINAKQIASVTVDFAAGQDRALGRGEATASVSRRAAAVPQAILDRISRKRRPGQMDAATDPMAEPEVRAALRAASFEVLIGFQLDDRALAYNVAK